MNIFVDIFAMPIYLCTIAAAAIIPHRVIWTIQYLTVTLVLKIIGHMTHYFIYYYLYINNTPIEGNQDLYYWAKHDNTQTFNK